MRAVDRFIGGRLYRKSVWCQREAALEGLAARVPLIGCVRRRWAMPTKAQLTD